MAFKELADLNCENATALGGTDRKSGKKNPTSIEGFFIGSRDVASPKSKTGFAALHVFQTAKGNQGVWGKTDLDSKLRGVTPGCLVRVTFTGMQETKNNPMYKFRVEVDADNTIDVATADAGSTAEDQDGSGESEDSYEEEADVGEDEAPADVISAARAQAPRRPVTAPSAEAQARTQALLARKRA